MTGKVFISALVGGILLFIWQSLSWAVLNVHGDAMAFSAEGQEEILEAMSEHLETNIYYLSYADPEATPEEFSEQATGRPQALVNYVSEYQNNMGPLMVRGLVYSFFVALVVSLVLARSRNTGFIGRFFTVMGFALVLILFDTLGDMNWWYHPMNWVWPEVIDYLVMFALSGIWMAWWMGRGERSY